MRKIIMLLLTLILISGCSLTGQVVKDFGVDKTEAKWIAKKFVENSAENVKITSAEKEGDYWKIELKGDGKSIIVEINSETGIVECTITGGYRSCIK